MKERPAAFHFEIGSLNIPLVLDAWSLVIPIFNMANSHRRGAADTLSSTMSPQGLPTSRRVFAARVLLKHLAALASQMHGARRAEDIEFVHQLRVASRRLRNALDLFDEALPRKLARRWTKQIRRLAKAMGAARDLDVQMVVVEKYLKELKAAGDREHRPGVERLLLRLSQQRGDVQPDVAGALDRFESSGTLEQMRESLVGMKVAARMHTGAPSAADLPGDARRVILLRLEKMLAFEPFIHSDQHVTEMHQMRIAAKHLRYTMEAYAGLFESRLREEIKNVRRIQTLLGDLHDCDVWLSSLPLFIEEEHERHVRFFGHGRGFAKIRKGIEHMLDNRRQKRREIYGQFVELWDELTKDKQWERLRDLLAEPMDDDTLNTPVEPTAAESAQDHPGPRSPAHGSAQASSPSSPPDRRRRQA
ncbi:MAG: CHAD domain-containing protein [Planctomycetes bacterium]|nr:CHAD domain-containing protein [Planctomycetota bacterium]